MNLEHEVRTVMRQSAKALTARDVANLRAQVSN